jgi:hypothetical protein
MEGFGPAYTTKLEQAGGDSVEALLRAGASPAGRKRLHEATGIDAELILRWVNHADLFRVPGMAGE